MKRWQWAAQRPQKEVGMRINFRVLVQGVDANRERCFTTQIESRHQAAWGCLERTAALPSCENVTLALEPVRGC